MFVPEVAQPCSTQILLAPRLTTWRAQPFEALELGRALGQIAGTSAVTRARIFSRMCDNGDYRIVLRVFLHVSPPELNLALTLRMGDTWISANTVYLNGRRCARAA